MTDVVCPSVSYPKLVLVAASTFSAVPVDLCYSSEWQTTTTGVTLAMLLLGRRSKRQLTASLCFSQPTRADDLLWWATTESEQILGIFGETMKQRIKKRSLSKILK